MPVKYPEKAGKPYRPSNGTEGMLFREDFCDHCKHEEDEDQPCEILSRAMLFDLSEIKPDGRGYPEEWIYDHAGKPTCTAYCHVDAGPVETATPRCPNTKDMFEDAPDAATEKTKDDGPWRNNHSP